MAEKKLNIDIERSVSEFESVAKKGGLVVDQKEGRSPKNVDSKSHPNLNFGEKLNLKKVYSFIKIWKNVFLIFFVFMLVLLLIFMMLFYNKTGIQEPKKIIQNFSKDYGDNPLTFPSMPNNSFFHLEDYTKIPEKYLQNFIIINDKDCNPNIFCKHVGYALRYDLSTISNETISLDKNVVNCYDSSNCVSNFTYLEPSEEPFSKQRIRIEKEGDNMLLIYDEYNVLIAKLERKEFEYPEKLNIWLIV